jgi:GntR family transcriptional regulator
MMIKSEPNPHQRTTPSEADASTPLFDRVKQALRREIHDGTYSVGAPLPPEPELCVRFGVSRATLRRAVDDLVHEGLVYRRQGSGTYVLDARIKLDPVELRGFLEELRLQGHEPTATVLERVVQPAPADVAAALRLAAGDPVIFLERLFRSRSEPLALSRSFFPYRTCAALMNADPSGSMYEIMEDELGLDLAYAEQKIEPQFSGAEMARCLGIGRRALLLVIERLTYLSNGEPAHYGNLYTRADRYKIETVLRRQRRPGRTAVGRPTRT